LDVAQVWERGNGAPRKREPGEPDDDDDDVVVVEEVLVVWVWCEVLAAVLLEQSVVFALWGGADVKLFRWVAKAEGKEFGSRLMMGDDSVEEDREDESEGDGGEDVVARKWMALSRPSKKWTRSGTALLKVSSGMEGSRKGPVLW
jgi:hypothetical protein